MTSFKEQLEKVSDFFKPENLAGKKIKYKGEVALLVIDVQKQFCDPKGERGNNQTRKISERIESLSSEFRKAGIPVYAVYFSYRELPISEIDFYKFTPQPDDKLVAKYMDSAFSGSDIKKTLKKDKRKLLLTCGFNLSACVMSTVLDARKAGFDVCLLRDLSGNDKKNKHLDADDNIQAMLENGVSVEESTKVLGLLKAKKRAPRA
jgi:nicotinamidase-related amidase